MSTTIRVRIAPHGARGHPPRAVAATAQGREPPAAALSAGEFEVPADTTSPTPYDGDEAVAEVLLDGGAQADATSGDPRDVVHGVEMITRRLDSDP